ncbi:MAG: bifunctional tRNA (5-methylaminomethyl-2-thiouridine)(34)-methyltransferase MnmD/FAD-dependent 5-carboxymethylaminomethyl-2-thiouridine(34) oxidoreductase MnmC [Halieaceae bacterium]|nr:bifunctional tRNA (5-methylaminomethyl-2-thiouridine)(34)-methyltransferase MnmD/FAD-dependent 5-carboxymethylaminomethyl-2-thiouridine(34) oxidoreductase MnmC [Halieaceae bacterium]
MILARGAFGPMTPADPTWDDNGRPRSSRYGDGYFGSEDSARESAHVFVDGSDLAARLAQHSATPFVVGELGFGTGLNFLLTWDCFARRAGEGRRLHFVSIEKHPLRRNELERCLSPYSDLRTRDLLQALPPPVEGVHRRVLDGGRVLLDLYYCDAMTALEELTRDGQARFDAWYLDGFSPAKNPEMWTPELLQRIGRSSRSGASVATFSAAGAVRRGLEAAGFSVQRRPGFGRKRECLQGQRGTGQQALPAAAHPAPTETPWDLPKARCSAPERVIVLGAGLAGCHVAAALARRGCAVEVFDAESPAARASGNPQGLLFHRLSHQRSSLADFSLGAFLYSRSLYGALFECGELVHGRDGSLDGCVQTAPPRGDFDAVRSAVAALPELARSIDRETATELLGTTSAQGGLWHPQSGWLSPPRVCAALLHHPAIRLRANCGPLLIRQASDGWRIEDSEARTLATAPAAVIAAGSTSVAQAALPQLPLRVARGQTTHVPGSSRLPLRHALCHRGYVAPAGTGEHCIGATFSPGDDSRELRIEDHRSNLTELARALPDWAPALQALNPSALDGRAELRCVSPDYLPLVGPVPDSESFASVYADLARDARQIISECGSYLPGLYLSTAMGSRGLSYAALAGELIASQIADEALPLPAELVRAVAPARFLIRAIVRANAIGRD